MRLKYFRSVMFPAAALLISFCGVAESPARQTATAGMATRVQTEKSTSQQWRELDGTSSFLHEMAILQSLGQSLHERPAVLARLHKMWTTHDVLRRPEIAYLMCQLGDRSGVEAVAEAFFAGEYDTAREVEPPDGEDAAGDNATDDAYRMLVLYGTVQHHQNLRAFLKLSDDPLGKGRNLCEILLGLSSTDNGPGLPVGYPKEKFPLELVMGCLVYTDEIGTIVYAPGGTVKSHIGAVDPQTASQQGSLVISGGTGVYPQRGSDYAAQTIQNLTSRDFGHRITDPVSKRDKAIAAIKQWWIDKSSGRSRRLGK